MPFMVILLVVLAVGAVAVAAYALLNARYREQIIGRTLGGPGDQAAGRLVIKVGDKEQRSLGEWVSEHVPESWGDNDATRRKLIWAGYDSPTAPLMYTTIRVALVVVVLAFVVPMMLAASLGQALLVVTWAIVAAFGLPIWFLSNRVYRRQERIRHAVPDALDLMVVCIEAGVSLDAAILRVAREIVNVHRELASELFIVNRKTNAGVPREQALRSLYDRTGVEEIRALVSTMIQSEKWGTSIGHVLEVYAETLRVKRRQAIEKKAATAPLKMLFPLMLFILPALFAVVMGPAVITIAKMFKVGFGS